ncbi:MAG: TetR/AcrR family transcriptional regulator [Acidimicrobiia bacterium]|nr:TetR/AcrR family transcriptional regulator [Acidimicrobiia bacterium]
MLEDHVLIGRPVDAGDLVVGDVTLQPPDLRPQVGQDLAGVPRDPLELGGAHSPAPRPLVKPSKAAPAEATRRDLIVSTRALFGERGYASTPVEAITRHAGVTEGALSHRFRDKDDLFRAVVEDVKRPVTDVVGAALFSAWAESETFESLVRGCRAFVEAHLDSAVPRISILDAHSEVAVVWGAFRRAMRLEAITPPPSTPRAPTGPSGVNPRRWLTLGPLACRHA